MEQGTIFEKLAAEQENKREVKTAAEKKGAATAKKTVTRATKARRQKDILRKLLKTREFKRNELLEEAVKEYIAKYDDGEIDIPDLKGKFGSNFSLLEAAGEVTLNKATGFCSLNEKAEETKKNDGAEKAEKDEKLEKVEAAEKTKAAAKVALAEETTAKEEKTAEEKAEKKPRGRRANAASLKKAVKKAEEEEVKAAEKTEENAEEKAKGDAAEKKRAAIEKALVKAVVKAAAKKEAKAEKKDSKNAEKESAVKENAPAAEENADVAPVAEKTGKAVAETKEEDKETENDIKQADISAETKEEKQERTAAEMKRAGGRRNAGGRRSNLGAASFMGDFVFLGNSRKEEAKAEEKTGKKEENTLVLTKADGQEEEAKIRLSERTKGEKSAAEDTEKAENQGREEKEERVEQRAESEEKKAVEKTAEKPKREEKPFAAQNERRAGQGLRERTVESNIKAENSEKKGNAEALKKDVSARGGVREKENVSRQQTAEEKLKEAFLQRLRSLSGEYFEYYSVYLLERYSLKSGRRLEGLRVSGGKNDGGIDGEIELTDRFGFRETIYIQAKNWDPTKGAAEKWKIGETLIQQFIGAATCRQMKDCKRNCRGIFVTTSLFTKEAKDSLAVLGEKFIGYDGDDVFETAKECEFGLICENGVWKLDEKLLSSDKAFFNM